ncbi:DUF1330 domain-containing protein [Sinomicrobium sp. M5D2P17]
MPAYYIISYNVIDASGYEVYVSGVANLLPAYGAEVLVSDAEGLTVEGNPSQINAIVVFPSKELALACYNFREYQNIKKIRLKTTKSSRFVLVGD